MKKRRPSHTPFAIPISSKKERIFWLWLTNKKCNPSVTIIHLILKCRLKLNNKCYSTVHSSESSSWDGTRLRQVTTLSSRCASKHSREPAMLGLFTRDTLSSLDCTISWQLILSNKLTIGKQCLWPIKLFQSCHQKSISKMRMLLIHDRTYSKSIWTR